MRRPVPLVYSIKNFTLYQHYKHRNPPWVKLHYSVLDDPAFLRLTERDRNRFLCLIMVASRCENRIDSDPAFLKKVLRIDEEPDLTPLIHAGFLLASRKQSASTVLALCKQNALSETESYKSSETELKESSEGKEKKRNPLRGTILPPDLQPNPQHKLMAQTFGLNVMEQFARFTDHHTSKGTIFKDWPAAFRNWLRRARDYKLKGQPT